MASVRLRRKIASPAPARKSLAKGDIMKIGQPVTFEIPGGVTLTQTLQLITPELALKMLGPEENSNNRDESEAKSDQYSRDMTTDDWQFTGLPTLRDWNGKLIDGQHRFRAIIKSGKPQYLFIIEGLDPAVRRVIDIGFHRNIADNLALVGVPVTARALKVTGLLTKLTLGRAQQTRSPKERERAALERMDQLTPYFERVTESKYAARAMNLFVIALVRGEDYGLGQEKLYRLADVVGGGEFPPDATDSDRVTARTLGKLLRGELSAGRLMLPRGDKTRYRIIAHFVASYIMMDQLLDEDSRKVKALVLDPPKDDPFEPEEVEEA